MGSYAAARTSRALDAAERSYEGGLERNDFAREKSRYVQPEVRKEEYTQANGATLMGSNPLSHPAYMKQLCRFRY
jgi:hypothetical protein